MRIPVDRKNVIRLCVAVVSLFGLVVATTTLVRFLRAVAANALPGGPLLTRYPEYYRQIGAHYATGFTTGFFVCYFLMLLAMIVGSWVDERRRARAARPEAPLARSEANRPPALVGEPISPE
jgi:hypothetical protein